jgi:hypothetical protein
MAPGHLGKAGLAKLLSLFGWWGNLGGHNASSKNNKCEGEGSTSTNKNPRHDLSKYGLMEVFEEHCRNSLSANSGVSQILVEFWVSPGIG